LGADPTVTEDDPQIAELAETIITISTEFGIITEYTAFLAREGTDLGDWTQILGQTTNTLFERGAADREGEGTVNQSVNIAMQRAQDILLLVGGEIVLIDVPADVEEEYAPVDPQEADQGNTDDGAPACPRRGR